MHKSAYCQWDGAKLRQDGSCHSCEAYLDIMKNKKALIDGRDARIPHQRNVYFSEFNQLEETTA